MTARQTRFVAHYLVTMNATQAATAAGYSPRTAMQSGSRLLLRNVQVAKAIAKGKRRQLHKNGLDADRVLDELRRCAFADARELFDDSGNLRPLTTWTAEQGACLAGFEVVVRGGTANDGSPDRIHKIKLVDKVKALEMLAKHFALMVDRVETNGGITVAWMPPEVSSTSVSRGAGLDADASIEGRDVVG